MSKDTEHILGYTLVRTYDSWREVIIQGKKPTALGDIRYLGVSRDEWGGATEAEFNDTAPHSADIRTLLTDTSYVGGVERMGHWMRLARSATTCRKIAELLPTPSNYEVLALFSNDIPAIERVLPLPDRGVRELGYDLFFLGGWSLVLEGVFWYSSYFNGWQNYLNSFGLLRDLASVDWLWDAWIDLTRPYASAVPGIADQCPIGAPSLARPKRCAIRVFNVDLE